ncbi:MAG: multiple sugar transport system permease protein [Actinomycetota bacterium]|nr:multiple sugar transport system permease protein [Actinomycetota bacterium]
MTTIASPTTVAPVAPARRKSSAHRRPTWKTVVLVISAYVIAFVFIFPYLDMILTAMRPQDELQTTAILPHHYTLSAFTSLWRTGLGKNLKVTLMVAGGATVLVLLVALPAAYYTSRHRFRGRLAFLLLVLITQMFQPTAMLVGIYREFFSFHLLNTVWSLILVNAGFNLAFAIWILNAYFSSIPRELEEAAMVEGTGRLGALFRITLPLAMPGVVTALIFTFIAAWNEFIVALTLTQSPSKMPLTVAINGFIGAYSVEWQHLFAASVIATIPVIILFALIERKVISGLTAGSIK